MSVVLLVLFQEENGDIGRDDRPVQVAVEPKLSQVRGRTGV